MTCDSRRPLPGASAACIFPPHAHRRKHNAAKTPSSVLLSCDLTCFAGVSRGRELHAQPLTARIAPLHLTSERQPPPSAHGLPLEGECLTYEQRYKHSYRAGLAHRYPCARPFMLQIPWLSCLLTHSFRACSSTANAQHPNSQYVVLLQMHSVKPDRIAQDLVMSVRAMAAEVAPFPSLLAAIHCEEDPGKRCN